MQIRSVSCALALLLAPALCLAQTNAPSAPTPQEAPSAPAPASAEPQFPPVEASNFTAAAPTKEDVEWFLKTSWGYDANREWEVYSIQKTAAPGISKVTILVAEKQAGRRSRRSTFFVTSDGKHLIAQDAVLDFGPKPYESNYHALQQRATGPSRGAADKKFELVEFADFQCPHCKDAQSIAEKLQQDFPQAHFVFESFPLVNIHPAAYKAATWGACVAQQGGNEAFFKYASSVFAAQNDLAGSGCGSGAEKLRPPRRARIRTRLRPAPDSPAGKSAVDASMRLGQELNVE